MTEISFATGSLGRVPILEEMLKKSLSKIDYQLLLNYGDASGLPELRKQIAKLYSCGITEENIMITSSAQQALNIVFEYLDKKNRIFAQEPTYFGTVRILRNKQNIELTTFEEIGSIEDKLKKMPSGVLYLTSNFHNPTGKTMSPEEKQGLAKKAKEIGLIIIEDNPYDFLYFGEEMPNNIFGLAPKNTLYVSGFSKMLAPGLRVGYIIADADTIKNLKSRKIDYDLFTSTLSQQVCLNALQHPEYLTKLRNYFKNKRDLALSCLDEQFSGEEGFKWNKPEGGIFMLGKLDERVPVDELAKVAQEHYRLILEKDGHTYFDGRSRNTIRINFVQNPDNLLKEGIERLHLAYEEVCKNAKTT